jgi:hypothetical protein
MILVLAEAEKNIKIVTELNNDMIRSCILIFGILFSLKLCSQGNIHIHEDPGVTKIMDIYLKINNSITHLSGWRITVITTTDRRLMEQTRTSFQQQFNLKTKWEYNEPYYYLKAGAFLSRSDAAYMLENIKKKFSSAFLSSDKISYDEL